MNTNVSNKLIQNKVGLLNLAEQLENISQACKIMGVSRDTFYRYRDLMQKGGLENLREKSRKKPNFANRVAQEIEAAVLKLSFAYPSYGKDRIADMLKMEGVFVSASGVYGVWIRHELSTPQKRLSWLERKAAEEGILLTEEQKFALEKKKEDLAAFGEIETEHPGYLGSQDTFYVGNLKGVGRIYQQTFVDTHSKVAICKLYTSKNSLTSADLLNDRVVPFFEKHEIPLLRLLTDRGSEFCGNVEDHPYELFLAVNEIEHSRTKAYHPQTNGICERFHRTVLDEFYRIAFRRKIYTTLDQLQRDLDEWIETYNERRPHQGKMCCGRTPWQTFLDGKSIWQHKQRELGLPQTVQPSIQTAGASMSDQV